MGQSDGICNVIRDNVRLLSLHFDLKCEGVRTPFSPLQEQKQAQTRLPCAAAYWSLSGYDPSSYSDSDGEAQQQGDSDRPLVTEEGGKRSMKYVVVTGGVVSGLGKGITASSIGVVLKACGLRVTSIKIGEGGGREGQREPLCMMGQMSGGGECTGEKEPEDPSSMWIMR